MNTQTFTDVTSLVLLHCPVCGCVYGLEENYKRHKRESGESWYCPNGHYLGFVDESITEEAARLKKALKQEKENSRWWREEAESKARSLSATKGVLTRTKNRIANGICPCCKRQFTNLQRHMETKHPNWAGDE